MFRFHVAITNYRYVLKGPCLQVLPYCKMAKLRLYGHFWAHLEKIDVMGQRRIPMYRPIWTSHIMEKFPTFVHN